MAKIKMTMQAGFTGASFVSASGGRALPQMTYSTRIKCFCIRACSAPGLPWLEGVLTSFEAGTKDRGYGGTGVRGYGGAGGSLLGLPQARLIGATPALEVTI